MLKHKLRIIRIRERDFRNPAEHLRGVMRLLNDHMGDFDELMEAVAMSQLCVTRLM
jgi:hypothetical protein